MNSILSFVLKAIGFSILSIGISAVVYKKCKVIKSIVRTKIERFGLFKRRIKTIIISPVIEELIFRYQIYSAIFLLDIDGEKKKIVFLILSSIVFTLSHNPRTIRLLVEKMIVGGLLYSLIYIVYKDVLLMIVIHILHNFYVVLIQENERQGNNNEQEENRIIQC